MNLKRSESHKNIYLRCSNCVKKHILDNVIESFAIIGNLK